MGRTAALFAALLCAASTCHLCHAQTDGIVESCADGEQMVYALDGPHSPLTDVALSPGQCGQTCISALLLGLASSMGAAPIVGTCVEESSDAYVHFVSTISQPLSYNGVNLGVFDVSIFSTTAPSPTESPTTPSPTVSTSAPTDQPTPSPTTSPTSPTESPTTPSPTVSTSAPTDQPTPSPTTPSPTDSPTTSSPTTTSPTSPTMSPTTSAPNQSLATPTRSASTRPLCSVTVGMLTALVALLLVAAV